MKRESRSYRIGDVQVSRIDELTLNVFQFETLIQPPIRRSCNAIAIGWDLDRSTLKPASSPKASTPGSSGRRATPS